jgi:hypothetical protein
MIYGPKTERILAGVLTLASGGWLILILLGYWGSLGWGHVLGLVRVVRHRRRLAADGKKANMTTLRTHFTFRVDTWTPDGESIVEHLAGVETSARQLRHQSSVGRGMPSSAASCLPQRHYPEGTANFAFVEPERECGPAPFGRHSACTICRARDELEAA